MTSPCSRRLRRAGLALALTTSLGGCNALFDAGRVSTIEALPTDASIVVNAEDLGKGLVKLPDRGHGFARKLYLVVRRDGHKAVQTELEAQYDPLFMFLRVALDAALFGGFTAAMGSNISYGTGQNLWLGIGGLVAADALYAIFGAFKFEDRYVYVLEPRAGAQRPATPAPASVPAPAVADQDGELSDVDYGPAGAVRDPRTVAVVLGVERPAALPAAPYARRDALVFARYMRTRGAAADRVLTVLDASATRAGMESALGPSLKSLVVPGLSDVFVYYAGHGVSDPDTRAPALVPYDADAGDVAATCFPLARLYQLAAEAGARSVTVVLDAGFTGAGRGAAGAQLVAGAAPALPEAPLVRAPGLVVFGGARGDEAATGLPAQRHGLYTYHFLKGLQGEADADGDRRVTAAELQAYVADRVPAAARQLGHRQTPAFAGDDAGRELIRFGGAPAKAAPSPAPTPSPSPTPSRTPARPPKGTPQ